MSRSFKYFIVPAVFGMLAFSGHSQKLSDTLKLKEVEVVSTFSLRTDGFKKISIKSGLLIPQINADLSTVLSQHSTVYVKSYGSGSLATPSMRGTTAGHTQVEWNGISINSPMLGMTDLSQVPSFQFNEVEILFGAAGIAKTSGAFGGVVNLITSPVWDNHLAVTAFQSVGSFDTYNNNLSVTAGNEKVQSISRIYYTYSKNNYTYNDEGTEKTRTNSDYNYYGGSEELFFKISPKDIITTRIWYNHTFLNLPPPISTEEPAKKESQENSDLYSKVEWNHLGKKNLLTVWTGLVDHFLQYTEDGASSLYVSNHYTYSWLNKVRWTYSGLKKFIIKPGIDYTYDWAVSDSYSEKKTRSTLSMFSEFILKYPEDFSFSLVLRKEYMDGHFQPLIAAVGGEFDPLKSHNLAFNINLSKNYKYPTLNDLYWEVLGNPDLKPESDYAAEAGLVYRIPAFHKKLFMEAQLTGYYSKMDDLIFWTPGSDGKFRPANVDQVVARGIETGLNIRWKFDSINIMLDNNYHFCKSTNQKTNSSADESLGKQLIYIPVHTFNSTATISFYGYQIIYNVSWFSKRYTSTNNQSYMQPYSVSNIIFGKSFKLEEILLSLQLQLNNLFDLDYQSIANYPMPGRNMAVTLKFDFGK